MSQGLEGRRVDTRRRNADQLPLRIAEGCEAASMYAPGIDVDRVVDPDCLGYREMPPDDNGIAVVVMGPIGQDLDTVLVPLAGRRAKQGDVARSRRVDAMEVLRQSGMRNHQGSSVQDEV
jgi:hypothetical protein